jgi:AmmeMemoRadiSam system protein A
MFLKGFLLPHAPVFLKEIGGADRLRCGDTLKALEQVALEVKALDPQVIILISPHGALFSDGIAVLHGQEVSGNLSAFGHPKIQMTCRIESTWVEDLLKASSDNSIPVVAYDSYAAKRFKYPYSLDHGALVPLQFIQEQMPIPKIVHLTYGLLSYSELYRFGRLLRTLYNHKSERTVIIASGDLSHALSDDGPYSYHPSGCVFDNLVVEAIKAQAFDKILTLDEQLIHDAKECGYRSLIMLMGMCAGVQVESHVLSYEGPFGVGYGVATFKPNDVEKGEDYLEKMQCHEAGFMACHRSQEDDLVKLARLAIESIVIKNHKLLPSEVPFPIASALPAGVFVSIKNASGLRGCIGTLEPTQESIIEEIIENAISAAKYDVRFNPIEERELEGLRISVDVLGEPICVTHKSELNPDKYGVIVRKGKRCGVLLPHLEGVDTVEEQLRIACQKAGIPKDSQFDIEKFEVMRHSPWENA